MGIEIVHVTKQFGSVVAVDDFSLQAEAGELLAIVGPSGCGKTTLLRIIAGLELADAGQVFIGGRDATALPPEKRNVGFVFQQFALFPNMNVAENIGYGLRRQRVERRERQRRVAELLSMIGMEAHAGRRPAQLSAGQQQRVALARALAPEPRTLLLDEPLSALDAAIRHQLRDELRRMQRRVGITTIMVTHDQEEALAVADRVAVMNEGRLEQVGPPWELYDRPATRFVARFIGRGNFLRGRRRRDGIFLAGLGLWPAGSTDARSATGADGEAVTVLLRPEAISVIVPPTGSPAGLAQAQDDVFAVQAVVHDSIFGGERAYLRLRLARPGDTGSSPGTSSNPGRVFLEPSGDGAGAAAMELLAAVPSGHIPRVKKADGETVTVVIPHDALRLLPD